MKWLDDTPTPKMYQRFWRWNSVMDWLFLLVLGLWLVTSYLLIQERAKRFALESDVWRLLSSTEQVITTTDEVIKLCKVD